MITIEQDITRDERGWPQVWYRWVCSDPRCKATGSWLHDHAKVERMSSAHAVTHVSSEART